MYIGLYKTPNKALSYLVLSLKILAKRVWDTSPFSVGFVWNLQLTCDTHS